MAILRYRNHSFPSETLVLIMGIIRYSSCTLPSLAHILIESMGIVMMRYLSCSFLSMLTCSMCEYGYGNTAVSHPEVCGFPQGHSYLVSMSANPEVS